MALAILTLLLVITAAAFAIERPLSEESVSPALGRLALLVSGTTLLLMLVGSYVSGSHYGLACTGWPLCNGEVIPSTDVTAVQVHFLHRALALALGLVLLALAWLAWRERARASLVSRLAVLSLVVYCVQAMIGAANIWTQLSDFVSAAHLTVGTLLWLLLALINVRVHRLYALLPSTSGRNAADLLRVAR
jgi:cytochrome c oxidase assembly protein subunit 15